MARDPLREACWRFEQIGPLLDARVTGAERHQTIRAMARVCVRWPSGREAPVPKRTLYRWLRAYQKDPRVESLLRAQRPRVEPAAIPAECVQYALAQLEEQPKRSLFILALRLQQRFQLPRPPSSASLHRVLAAQPRYQALRRRASGHTRLRRRFQAARAHDIWHADAKAAFPVRFGSGIRQTVRILSILDDATRFILAALVVTSESLAAAVAGFRRAAARWGLPEKFYADRGSAYDADAFRKGLAVLGIHRINTRPRNAPAHGKIEAYHRSLQRWFIAELPHQPVRDLAHLQELLDAFLDRIYHEHVHRELKQTPRAAFADAMSPRLVTLARLREAFLIETDLKAHPVTGEVRVGGRLFLVPKERLRQNRRVRIGLDPEADQAPFLVLGPGVYQPLAPAFAPACAAPAGRAPTAPRPPAAPEPVGALTPMLEQYRGRTLPQARGGFGLPEIYDAFAQAVGRPVPQTEAEATLVLDWLRARGPFQPQSFAAALDKVRAALGQGRPLAQLIRALDRLIVQPPHQENRP
jgi:transposase InsO family protein